MFTSTPSPPVVLTGYCMQQLQSKKYVHDHNTMKNRNHLWSTTLIDEKKKNGSSLHLSSRWLYCTWRILPVRNWRVPSIMAELWSQGVWPRSSGGRGAMVRSLCAGDAWMSPSSVPLSLQLVFWRSTCSVGHTPHRNWAHVSPVWGGWVWYCSVMHTFNREKYSIRIRLGESTYLYFWSVLEVGWPDLQAVWW